MQAFILVSPEIVDGVEKRLFVVATLLSVSHFGWNAGRGSLQQPAELPDEQCVSAGQQRLGLNSSVGSSEDSQMQAVESGLPDSVLIRRE